VFLDVNGVRLRAVSFGEGPRTFVAIGGWTGSWELWEQPFELLTRAGWRCVAYDHRGSGESPADPAMITVAAMAEEVFGVLDTLGIERCLLAGESMGGAIAQYAASRKPELFEGIVLVAPGPTGRREPDLQFTALCRADYPTAARVFVERCLPEPDSEHLKRWGRNILQRAEPEQAARMLEMWADEDVPELDPGTIALPVLIVHGTHDAVVGIESSRALAALLRDAELVVLDGAGHVPTVTRPADVVAAIGRRFGAAAPAR
jgi:pimeloyl-ACP methyl ester carboxylesterase